MKRAMLCIAIVVWCLVMVCYGAIAQDIPTPQLTKLIDPRLINITGTWNYISSASVVTGVCPPGGPASGTCTITKSGDTYTLKILSGRVCKPARCAPSPGNYQEMSLPSLTQTLLIANEGRRPTPWDSW